MARRIPIGANPLLEQLEGDVDSKSRASVAARVYRVAVAISHREDHPSSTRHGPRSAGILIGGSPPDVASATDAAGEAFPARCRQRRYLHHWDFPNPGSH